MALEMNLEFRSIDEPSLGAKWSERFCAHWPAYRRWFLSQGEGARPTYRQVVRSLNQHMPEFLPAYERMTELAGGGDFASRFLGQLDPPPFFAACSQAILVDDEPVLIRNYDYSPLLCDGLIMKTHWGERAVIAMTDSMSGVLDGMNDAGLAISLAFGGRRVVGEGFSVTLVQRYILETCSSVADACEVLRRIPVQVAYNISLVDRLGDHATVMLSPDREPHVSRTQIATNHQHGERWEKYTAMIESDARYAFLESHVEQPASNPDDLIGAFLAPPLFRDSYAIGYGTLFTSVYFPLRGEARYIWLDGGWHLRFDDFPELTRQVVYSDPSSSADEAPHWPNMHQSAARVPMGFITH